MNLLEQIKENAKKCNKRIVLPEGTEERTLKAADILIAEGIAQIILIGNPAEIKALAEKFELKNIGKATIIDPENHEKKEAYADLLVELRKSKGMTKEQALKLVLDQPGMIIPVVITVYQDKSFSFVTKTPPAAVLLKKACKIQKGAGNSLKETVATISKADLQQIAETKMQDLNAASIEAAMSMIAGTARSMYLKRA